MYRSMKILEEKSNPIIYVMLNLFYPICRLTDQEGHTKRLDSERSVSSIETADNSATQAVLKTWNAPSLTQVHFNALEIV